MPAVSAKMKPKPAPKSNFGPIGKNQRRISFRPIIGPNRDVSALSKVLSQYELLKEIARSLSSADLVHLAASSKEHQDYVTGSKILYKQFRESAICDGTGIRSRAHVFGHWNGDPSKATVKCLEDQADPCRVCAAIVCEVSSRIVLHNTPLGVQLT